MNNVLLTQPLDTYVTRIQTTDPSQVKPRVVINGRTLNANITSQTDKHTRHGSYDAIQMRKVDELKSKATLMNGCYNGLGASLILCVNPGIQYAIFEQLKRIVIHRNNKRNLLLNKKTNQNLSAFSAFLLGALSKSLSTFVTYPLIRGKVVQQVQNNQDHLNSHRNESLLEIITR